MTARLPIAWVLMVAHTTLILVGAHALGIGRTAAYIVLAVTAVPVSIALIAFVRYDELAPRIGRSRPDARRDDPPGR